MFLIVAILIFAISWSSTFKKIQVSLLNYAINMQYMQYGAAKVQINYLYRVAHKSLYILEIK